MMISHGPCQYHEKVFEFIICCSVFLYSCQNVLVCKIYGFTSQQILVLYDNTAENSLYIFKSIGKPIAVYIFQAKKYNRIFIHPFLAQLFFGRHPEPRKKIAAVLCDVEELRQHGQEECLAKTPRTGKKRDTRQTAGKKLVQEACLVNIIVLFPTDLGKTFTSDQDLHLGHRVSSLSWHLFDKYRVVSSMPAERKRNKHNFEPASGILTASSFEERLNGAFSQNLQGEIP